jgi:hypothetical protein
MSRKSGDRFSGKDKRKQQKLAHVAPWGEVR